MYHRGSTDIDYKCFDIEREIFDQLRAEIVPCCFRETTREEIKSSTGE